MGEAKRRGTFEQRQALAVERVNAARIEEAKLEAQRSQARRRYLGLTVTSMGIIVGAYVQPSAKKGGAA